MLQFNTNMMDVQRLEDEWYVYTSTIGVYQLRSILRRGYGKHSHQKKTMPRWAR